MEGNRETILDELNDFDKRSSGISPILEEYLLKIAKTGDTMFPWTKLKPLLRKKLEFVLDDFHDTGPLDSLPPLPNVETFKFEILKNKILEALDTFHSAPFTIQRICELLTTPRKHYKRTDKFMRGLEKNVLVVSTVEPKIFLDNEVNNNNAAGVMNGLVPSSNNDQTCKGTSAISSTIKHSSSDSQFDNFGMVSTSSSVIITDMSGTMQKEKIEIPESIKSPDSPDMDNDVNDNLNVSEMDVSSYKENVSPHLCKSNSDSASIDNQDGDNSSHDLTTTSSSGNNQTLENFTIFSSPSSPIAVSEITGISSNKKSEVPETDKSFNCNSEREIDLNTFQENCDGHLNENTMDLAPPVSKESYLDEAVHISSPNHTSAPDSQDFFQDLCCPPSGEEHTSTVFSHDSPDNFSPPSHKTEMKDNGSLSICNTEKTIASGCNTASVLPHDKDISENEISSHTVRGYEVHNDETGLMKSEKGLFSSSIVSTSLSSQQDSMTVISKKEADSNSNLIDSPSITPVQGIMDVVSSSTNEQIDLSQGSEVSRNTNEPDTIEMEQD